MQDKTADIAMSQMSTFDDCNFHENMVCKVNENRHWTRYKWWEPMFYEWLLAIFSYEKDGITLLSVRDRYNIHVVRV